MRHRSVCAVAFAVLAAPFAATAAEEVPAGLELSTEKVRTDPAGAFVSVAVKNTTSTTFAQIVVACTFTGGGAPGRSTTTLFSVVGGTTGYDQVRLLGATAATAAACEITRAQ